MEKAPDLEGNSEIGGRTLARSYQATALVIRWK